MGPRPAINVDVGIGELEIDAVGTQNHGNRADAASRTPHKEINSRTIVVSVFPNPAALLRLAGAVFVAEPDPWEVDSRGYVPEDSMRQLNVLPPPNFDAGALSRVIRIPELRAA